MHTGMQPSWLPRKNVVTTFVKKLFSSEKIRLQRGSESGGKGRGRKLGRVERGETVSRYIA